MSHNNNLESYGKEFLSGFLNIFQRLSPSNSPNNDRTLVNSPQEYDQPDSAIEISSIFQFIRFNSSDRASSKTSVPKKRVTFSEPISSAISFSEEIENQDTEISRLNPENISSAISFSEEYENQEPERLRFNPVIIPTSLFPGFYHPISPSDESIEIIQQIPEDTQEYLNSIFTKFDNLRKKTLEINEENNSLKQILSSDLRDLFYENEDQNIKSPRFCGCFERLKKLIFKNKSLQIKPLNTEIDTYDDLYQRYIKGVVKKKYLAFILVNEYLEVFNLSKIYGRDLIRQFDDLTIMVNLYFDDAIEFFCDYANENAKYDFRLSLQQVKNFLVLCKEIIKDVRESNKVIIACNQILSTFSDQEKIQELIDFFSEPNLKKRINFFDDGLFRQNFQELENRILHAIDNPLNNSLSIDQQKKYCEIYIKIKGKNYDFNTTKIQSHLRQLNDKKEEGAKTGVKSLVMFFELMKRTQKDISSKSPDDSSDKTESTKTEFTSEIKFEENILKKTYIDSLKYQESPFNSYKGKVLNNPIPKPLVVEASQVMKGVKYPPGTEFCC